MNINLTGLSTRIGSKVITSEEIADRFGKPLRRIKKCGITVLYRFSEKETLEGFAAEGARESIERAGIFLSDISGIYASVGGPNTEYLMPGLARVVGKKLGLKEIPMITLSMGCVGGIHALQIAYNQLVSDSLSGINGNYLIVVGDHTSRCLDETNWETAPLFSDGVASVILSNQVNGKYTLTKIGSRALEGDILTMRVLNPSMLNELKKATFEMDGEDVFNFATFEAFPAILKILGIKELPTNCYLIPHQASGLILGHIQGRNNIPENQIYKEGIGLMGNLSGASVYFGLEDVIKRNLAPGKDIILGAFGAEYAVGAAYFKRN